MHLWWSAHILLVTLVYCSAAAGAGRHLLQTRATDVRLVNGTNSTSGRVEVLAGGAWKTVCDDNWDNADALAVCGYLFPGYQGLARGSATFGLGTGSIVYAECRPSSSSDPPCVLTNLYPPCQHYEDAGVVCWAPAQSSTGLSTGSATGLSTGSATGLSTGAIVGIACGAAAAVCVGAFIVARKRRPRLPLQLKPVVDEVQPHSGGLADPAPSAPAPPPDGAVHLNVDDAGPAARAAAGPVGVTDVVGRGSSETTPTPSAASPAASSAPLAAHLPELDTFISGGSAAQGSGSGTLPCPLPHPPPDVSAMASVSPGCESVLASCPTRPPMSPPMSLESMLSEEEAAAMRAAVAAAPNVHPATGPGGGSSATGSTAAREAMVASQPGSAASPGTPPVSVADPHSLVSSTDAWAATASAAALASDPLLSYILQSRVSTASGASGASAGSGEGAGATLHSRHSVGVDVQPWRVAFRDITFLEPVGEGSYGKVYLALYHEIPVAVKVLLGGQHKVQTAREAQHALALSSPILAKLEAEAGLLASLRHPYIVSFYGICHDPPCIITEYCAKGSLTELLAEGREDPAAAAELTWRRRLSMALNAALGMLHLHNLPSPIVHRDLKSPNLLVDEAWRTKVADFNLSKILEDSSQGTSMAAMNPRWLAPEVMHGARATPASDVFSFGVVLWELCTWQLPWGNTNPWQLASFVQRGGRLELPAVEDLPGPDTAAFTASGGLRTYCEMMAACWAQEPAQRPSFAELVPRLRELVDQAPRV